MKIAEIVNWKRSMPSNEVRVVFADSASKVS